MPLFARDHADARGTGEAVALAVPAGFGQDVVPGGGEPDGVRRLPAGDEPGGSGGRDAEQLLEPAAGDDQRLLFDGPLQLARTTFGDERIIFSVDYPFSENKHATDWLRQLDLPAETRERIAHSTADALLGLH